VQTILEVGLDDLPKAIADAFDGAEISVAVHDGLFELQLHQPGMLRPLRTAELSDGTLRFLLWAAALLSPRPPSLSGLLRANYPDEARQRGLRGSASLRARIDADGVIRNARVRSESSAGFGSACRRTLLGSRWSAPRDKNGSAVATEIVYTCHFEIDQ
jgi:TonB family protein